MAAPDKLPPAPLPPNQAAAQLLYDLFEGESNPLTSAFGTWIISKPFLAFGQTYHRKIRKKIRMSRDSQETYNLYCELRTAYLLLQEPKFAVAYEPYSRQQGRSADFAVTFRTNTVFHVEVTRLRASQHELQLFQQGDAPANQAALEEKVDLIRRYERRRLADVVCDKLGQFSAETPNILWVWTESRVMAELDIGEVMLELKRRAEQRDSDLFARYRFSKPADFIRYFQRLSAILVQNLSGADLSKAAPDNALLWWQNKDSRNPLPSIITNRLHTLVTADNSPAFISNHEINP